MLAVAAVFTALVCVATMVFSVYVPATRGFFNIGESMVFLSALLFGPIIGTFAGGVGSALSDILLGYPYYAPGTLVIKACEGCVVGVLRNRNPKFKSKIGWKAFTLVLGVIAGGLLAVIGTLYFSGESELALGSATFSVFLPFEFWLILGSLATLSIAATGLISDPQLGWTVLSVITGGLTMVLGYFIYEMFFIGWLFGIQAVAIAEIPVNIGQMVIGAMIALPVAKIAWSAFPQLRKETK